MSRVVRDEITEVHGEESVKAYGNSTVYAYDESVVRAYDESVVKAYDNSVVKNMSPHAIVVDTRNMKIVLNPNSPYTTTKE